MSYVVLARKWRPKRFADLVGQDVVVRTLTQMLLSRQLPHAFLLTGIRGVGKTTIARLMAMAVNCVQSNDAEPCGHCSACVTIAQGKSLDVQEMDAASHTSVDDIREILEGVRYPAVNLPHKVYIIDEAHMLSKSAFNALLKTLEEPPERVLFILATTESDKLPVTVRSRCQRFDLRRLGQDEIIDYLDYVLRQESIAAEKAALQRIAQSADGSVRDALSLTERVLAYSRQSIDLHAVEASLGLVGHQLIRALAEPLLAANAALSLQVLRYAMATGHSTRALLQSLLALLHQLSCVQVVPQLLNDEVDQAHRDWLQAWAACWDGKDLDVRYQVLLQALRDLSLSDERRSAEMVVLRLCHLGGLSQPKGVLPPLSPMINMDVEPKKKIADRDVARGERVSAPAMVDDLAGEVRVNVIEPVLDSMPLALLEVCESVVEDAIEKPLTEEVKAEVAASTSKKSYGFGSWHEVLEAYAQIRPMESAMLEQVGLLSFSENEVHLALSKHQQELITPIERITFAEWLGRDVIWDEASFSHSQVESLAVTKAREAKAFQENLRREAEEDPHVQGLMATLDCTLRDVRMASGAEEL
ncbi:MAG: DNA polymerase III subunit gamma/tau [Zetaproteobacteria bacterium]|nr:DNA polymerase III subunit gamma/tau [Zetaproteobacteria bacterium]